MVTQGSERTDGARLAGPPAARRPDAENLVRLLDDMLPGHHDRAPVGGRVYGGPVVFGRSADALDCFLPPERESVRAARVFTEKALRDWDIPHLLDPLALVVSELVTNAVRYGVPGALDGLWAGQDERERIQLGLLHTGSCVLCAVWDPNETAPTKRSPDHLEDGGRGLCLVESLSQAWGFLRFREAGEPAGKAVWAFFQMRT